MIEAYSNAVPIFPGEYILNVFARGDAQEIQDAVSFLGGGELSRLEEMLTAWMEARGHGADEIPALLQRRRKEMGLRP